MKKQQLRSLNLKKQSISTLLTGGKTAIPTTLKTNATCGGGICDASVLIACTSIANCSLVCGAPELTRGSC